MNVTDDFLHRNAIVHELAVPNDQWNKAVRYVKSGHFDVNNLILRHVNSSQHGRLLLVSAGCLASRKSQVYSVRVCIQLGEAGDIRQLLPPPYSQCTCVVHLSTCAHSLGCIALAAVVGMVGTTLRGQRLPRHLL